MKSQKSQKSQSEKLVGGNTRPQLRARRWCGTWNNYTEEDLSQITQDFKMRKYIFTIGRETGKNGTPHLQIYFENNNQLSFNSLKKRYPKVHWEKARGNSKQNYEYCKKEGTYISTQEEYREILKKELLKEYEEIKWKPWQQEILNIINTKPDNRKINWYWETTGNVGKSFLSKYIAMKYNTIIAEGKKNDVFNQVNTMIENKKEPKIIILDIPRYSKEFTNYGLLECLKNGMLYSGKYEGGLCFFHSPHVFIFANFLPSFDKMSEDRWNVKAI